MTLARTPLACLLVLATLSAVAADVYMHNPRGSNDRNCERNVNRRNGNRLFDSQNNAKGGYACPRAVGGPVVLTPKIYYYVGSKLPIEWTAQHGCGTNPKEECQVVIQYACEDTLDPEGKFRSGSHVGTPRDGIPTDAQDDATDTIPATPEAAVADTTANRRYGMHESIDFYNKCRQRKRNTGLFTADQKVRRRDARGTRQNPNGNRRGLECPEERDYYPYWHPTPWRDVAVLSTYTQRCNYFQSNSQNVRNYGECRVGATDALKTTEAQLRAQGRWYNNKEECEEKGNMWVEYRFGYLKFIGDQDPMPFCGVGSFGRINHLGNVDASIAADAADLTAIPHRDNAARYIWTIPDHPNENCVLRLRYNISTGDYPAWDIDGNPVFNATYNKQPPIQQDPYVDIGTQEDEFVSLALNTNQYGRTFQDRSYVFEIRAPSAEVKAKMDMGAKIYNLNVRGKRGNIVQTYPAVEYDFVPNDLNVNTNDMIHFQWTGSDYNPRRGCNDAEGGPPDPVGNNNANARADRSNIIEMTNMDDNFPRDITTAAALQGKTMFTNADGTPDMNTVMELAFLNQKQNLAAAGRRCLTREELDAIQNKNERETNPHNCAKINAAMTPYFDAGLKTMRANGAFTYFSSRNNNFSNRDQTGRICVGSPCGEATPTAPRGINNIAGSGGTVSTATIAGRVVALSTAQQEEILAEETFDLNAKDNDAFGDGEEADCEEMRFNFDGISSGAAVGLAFSMIAVGAAVTLGAQYGVRRYRQKQADALKPAAPAPRARKYKPVGSDKPGVQMTRTKKRGAPPPPPRRR